jgi:hypothetical protein
MDVNYSEFEKEGIEVMVSLGEALRIISGEEEAKNDFEPFCDCGEQFDLMDRTADDFKRIDLKHAMFDRGDGYTCDECGDRWEFFVGQNKKAVKENLS